LEQRGQPHTRRGRGDRVAARPSRETGGGIRKGGGARSRNQAQQTCVSRDLREVSVRSWGLVVLLFDLPFELSQRLTAKSRVPPVNRIADPGFRSSVQFAQFFTSGSILRMCRVMKKQSPMLRGVNHKYPTPTPPDCELHSSVYSGHSTSAAGAAAQTRPMV
jgi:hypothetical protein